MLIYILLLIDAISPASIHDSGINIEIIHELTLPVDEYDIDPFRICFPAVITESDSIIVGTLDGIWITDTLGQTWIKMCPWPPKTREYKDLPEYVPKLSPGYIYALDSSIVIMDRYYYNIYRINSLHDSENSCRQWISLGYTKKNEWYNNMNISGSSILIGLVIHSGIDSSFISMKGDYNRSDRGFRRVFKCSDSLSRELNINGIGYPFSIPAYNPIDCTIWAPIYGYEYIYILDTLGTLLDSILINDTNFKMPTPPKSRIRSTAVWRDWISHWTPPINFNFVPPGYFILQTRNGFEISDSDTIPLFNSLIWDLKGQPVENHISQYWQISGVGRNGNIIFTQILDIEGHKELKIFIAGIF